MNAFIVWFEARAAITAGIVTGVMATLIIGFTQWRKLFPWCKAHAQFMAGCGSGAAAGAFVILLFGANPTDTIAGLIGAFAGIVAAIGGGLWLWQVQDETAAQRIGQSICRIFDPIFVSAVEPISLRTSVIQSPWADQAQHDRGFEIR